MTSLSSTSMVAPIIESNDDDDDDEQFIIDEEDDNNVDDDYDHGIIEDENVYNDDIDNHNDTTDIEYRLNQLKVSIDKIAKDSYQQATITSLRTTTAEEEDSNTKANKNNYDKSFQLGLSLFGQSIESIEENVQEQLTKMEHELQSILTKTSSRDHDNRTAAKTKKDSYKLQVKIQFLKHCSKARSLVDQAIQLSTPGLSSSDTAAATTFDNTDGMEKPGDNNENNNLIIASKYIVQATKELSLAQQIIDNIGTTTTTDMTMLGSSASFMKQQYAYAIIDSIQADIRRKKVELINIANFLFTSCITINGTNNITTGAASASATTNSIIVRSKNNGLRTAYDILEIFYQYNQNNASTNSLLDFNNNCNNCTTSALGDALRKFTRTLYNDVFSPVLENHTKKKKQQDEPPEGKKSTLLNNTSSFHYSFQETSDDDSSNNNSYAKLASSSLLLSTKIGSVSSSSLTKGPIYKLEWTTCSRSSKNDDEDDTTSDWEGTFDYIQRILLFVSKHVLLQRELLNKYVIQNLLLGKPYGLPNSLRLESLGIDSVRFGMDDNGLLLEPLLTTLEECCIPTYLNNDIIVSELNDRRKKLNDYITTLISTLTEHGIILHSNNNIANDYDDVDNGGGGITKLLSFVESFHTIYVANRRCILINKTRNLLLNNDYYNTVQVGEDVRPTYEENEFGLSDGLNVFKLHKAAVSDSATQLMQLIRTTMDEAVAYQDLEDDEDDGGSPLLTLPATLYRVARDMFDLFRSIIPVVHGYEITTIPRMAGIMHNDCVYFAYNCLTLGLEYKDQFAITKSPPSSSGSNQNDARSTLLRQTCMFVDMVPLFRNLADRSMGDMLDLQARQIVELLSEKVQCLGQSLSSDHIVPEWSDAESGVNASLYHLKHLSNIWKPILSYSVLHRSLYFLSDVIFTILLNQITAAGDISSSACQFIHTLFDTTITEIESNILVDGKNNKYNKASYARTWDRFVAIGKFMDMSILDIQTALSDGVFLNVTAAELSKLITSCFDDTPKRQNLLKLLLSSSSSE